MTPSSERNSLILGSDPARAHLVAERPTVSGRHCVFRLQPGGEVLVEDLGSTNGTWVGETRLTQGQPVQVALGDVVRVSRRARFLVDSRLLAVLRTPEAWRYPMRLRVDSADTAGDSEGVLLVLSDDQRISGQSPAPAPPVADHRPPHITAAQPAARTESVPPESPDPDASLDAPIDEEPPPSLRAVSLTIGYADSNDLVIPNAVVSARHARLWLDGERILIEDQGSTNGTLVRGRPVRRARLRVGDPFSLGSYRMVFTEALYDRLVELREQARSEDRQVEEVRWRIGRDPANDIVLDAAMVSANHAELQPLGQGRFVVRDLGSTNGTWLGNRDNRVTEAIASAADVLWFGSYKTTIARLLESLKAAEERPSRLVTGRAITIGRDPTVVDVAIDRPAISRRHAEIRLLSDGRFEIRDLGSSNGVYVEGKRIREPVVVGADARVALGSCQIRLDPDHGVVHKAYHGDIMLSAERISVDVPDPRSPGGRKRIVNDVSFTAYPTEFVGLMGPSGAGKTTLLLALNGYLPPSAGRSLVNGEDLYENYDAFRGNIGYVPQDDIVYPQLTVYESLLYTARLRLPADTTRAEIDTKIERVLEQLEISQARDVLIGDAVRKGISGGQRKRVNLAQELITEPSLLLLDEPTSGLASEDAINVMRLLRELSNAGKTVVLTIHQPSLEAYRLMDNVIYLFQGSLVYYGPAYPDSILYFNGTVPAGPDRERLLADPGNALKPLAREQRAIFEAPDRADRERGIAAAMQKRRAQYIHSRYHRDFVYERSVSRSRGDVDLRAGNKQRTVRRGLLRQWGILVERSARIKWRDRLNTAILMVQAPVIAAVLALVFASTVGNDGAYFESIARGPAALFLLVASAVWFGCSNSAREIVGEQAIYRRERMVNLMIPSYVLSKFTVLGVVCALQCLMLLGIVYAPLGLEGSFAAMYGILLLVSLAGLGMGLTLSSLVSSGEAAIALVPLLLIPQIILGGVIMPVHQLTAPMKVLSSTMVARWGYEGLLHVEYGDDDLGHMRDACGIPDCAWGVGPTGYAYYPADPADRTEDVSRSGVSALRGGVVAAVQPTNDADLCQAFCSALQNGQPLTPIDRSFGADPHDPLREEAMREIAEEGHAPASWTRPAPHARAGPLACLALLLGMNVFLFALVCSLMKHRDVEVG